MAFDPTSKARNMVEALGEEEARRRLEASSYPEDRLVLQALNGGRVPAPPAPRPADPEDEPGGATRALRFLGGGLAKGLLASKEINPFTYAPGGQQMVENVERVRDENAGDPEGVAENVAYYGGRLLPEALLSVGAGSVARRAIGQLPKTAPAVSRLVRGLGRSVITNTPSTVTFGRDPEEAILPTENDALRYGAEFGAGMLGEGLFAGAGRLLGRLRKPAEAAVEAAPSEAIGKSVEDLAGGLRSAEPEIPLVASLRAAPEPKALVPEIDAPYSGPTAEELLSMTPREIKERVQRELDADKTLLRTLFGEEGAKRYNRLQGIANSTSRPHAETDAAYDEIVRMEDSLSESQRNRLFGIGGEGILDLDELKAIREAAHDYDPEFLSEKMGETEYVRTTDDLLNVVGREFLTGRPNERVESAIRLREAAAELQRRGLSEEEIVERAISGRALQEGIDPGDAMELFRATMEAMGRGAQKEAGPRLLPPPSRAIGKSLEDLTSGLRGRTAPGAREILEGERETLTRAADLTARAERAASAVDVSDDFIRKELNVPKFTGGDETLEPDLLDAAREVYAQHGLGVKGPKRTFEIVREAARDLNIDDVLAADAKNLTDAQALMLRNYGNRLLLDKQELARRMGDGALSPEERKAAQEMYESASVKLQDVVAKHFVGGAEDSRRLGARRIMGKAEGDPFVWAAEATRANGGRLTDVDEAEVFRLAKAVREAPTPEAKKAAQEELLKKVGGLEHSTFAEQFGYIWRGMLLTLPVSHITNVTSTAAHAGAKQAAEPASFLFDRIMGAFSGIESVPRTTGAVTNILRKSRGGLGAGAERGAAQAWRAIKGEISVEQMEKLDIAKRVNFRNPIARAIKTVLADPAFRMLEAEDRLLGGPEFRRNLAAEAIRVSKQAGYTGQDAAAKVFDLMENPSDEMVLEGISKTLIEEARKRAKEETEHTLFRNRSFLARGTGRMREGLDTISGGFAGKFFMPFTSTPSNVAITGFNMTPLGFAAGLGEITGRTVLKAWREAVKKQGAEVAPWMTEEAQRRIAKKLGSSTTFSAPFVAGYLAAQAGILTGAAPRSPAEREQFFRAGKQPYSFKIGDQWHRLERFQPVSTPFVLAADVYRVAHEEEMGLPQKALSIGASQAQFVAESPFATGIKEAGEILTDIGRYGPKEAERFAGTLVPAALRGIARGTDKTVRRPEGFMENIKANLPGFSGSVAPMVDPTTGQEVERDMGVGGQLFNPLRSTRVSNEPLARAFERLGYAPPSRQQKAGESNAEYADRLRDEGRQLGEALDRLMKRSSFRRKSPEEQMEALDDEIRSERDKYTERRKREARRR